MEEVDIIDVCGKMIALQKKVDQQKKVSGMVDLDTATLLADCRDYVVFLVADAIEKDSKSVSDLLVLLTRCKGMCESENDREHVGFFFSLSLVLSLKFGLGMFKSETISREDFEESWTRTREALGL